MSKLPTLIPETDLSDYDLGKVKQYIEEGMPGIKNITDAQIHKMFELYLSGSTYSQIAHTVEIHKTVVLYLAHHAQWYQTKREYLNEIQEKIKNRIMDTKLRNHEFMLLLVQAWQKKIGRQLTRYLATNDSTHMESLNLKEIGQLMKAIEMVNELDNQGKDSRGKTPAVGLNVGDGVVIEKTGENQVSISPKKASSVGDLLQNLADSQRQKEKALLIKQSDINNENGDNNESK